MWPATGCVLAAVLTAAAAANGATDPEHGFPELPAPPLLAEAEQRQHSADASAPAVKQQKTRTQSRRRWTTPSTVGQQTPQEVESNVDLPDYGKFLIHTGVKAAITSPGYPDDYPPYVWTTWIFEAKDPAATLQLRCPDFALGGQDSLSLETEEDGNHRFFRGSLLPPAAETRGQLNVQLRSGRTDHGRLRCTIGAVLVQASQQEADYRPVPVNDPLCGRAKHATRIVGGEAAPKNVHPWLVGVTTRSRADMFCGGSIINERFILTAAHCVRRRKAWVLNVQVRKHNRHADRDELRFKVKRIIPHPGYRRATLQDDIAVLELEDSLRVLLHNEDGRVRPVCLPREPCAGGDGAACFSGRTGTVAGWGVLKEHTKDYPTALQQVELPILSSAECRASQPNVIRDGMLCTSYSNGGRDACQGDSGGPLTVVNADGVTSQAGVVSFGKGCGKPQYPAVYTRVSEYFDWITENAKL